MSELIVRSKDFERISIRSSNNFKKKNSNEIKEYLFDNRNNYIPSKEFIKNKKNYIIEEEKLIKRNKKYPNSKIKTKITTSKLIKSIEKEIFKNKK